MKYLLLSVITCNIYVNAIFKYEFLYPICTNNEVQNKSSIFCERASAKDVHYFIRVQNPNLLPLEKLLSLRFTLIYPKDLDFENIESLEIYRSIILEERTFIKDAFTEIQRLPSTLTTNVFQSFSKLKNLTLHHNQITSIKRGAFNKLNTLQFLNLAFNKLKSINPNSFDHLLNLEVLDLRENQIETIYSQSFEKLQKLKILYFQGNLLSKLNKGLFTGLIHLQQLHLQENSITVVNSWALKDSINLKFLNISQNKINFIEKNSFTTNNRNTINIIDLSRNKLETLDREAFDHIDLIEEIILNDNPLMCSCRIKWFYEWLTKMKKKDVDRTFCTPVIEINMVPIMEARFENCRDIDLQPQQMVKKELICGKEGRLLSSEKEPHRNEENVILHSESISKICELMQQHTYLTQSKTNISVNSKYKVINANHTLNLTILESNICMESLDKKLVCFICYGKILVNEKLYLNNTSCECLSPQQSAMYDKENYYSPLIIGILAGVLSFLIIVFIIFMCRITNKKKKKNPNLLTEI